MKKFDLNQWQICNPDNRQDSLPQPYKLIDDILKETILHNLSLSMHEIQQKKKDKNYQGGIKQYAAQNVINVQNICCLSSEHKSHNHLIAGDKSGNIYLLDLAKKIVFSKKQLFGGRRVINISQDIISDGQNSITTIAVILNNHNKIYILRYKHSQPKLILSYQIQITIDQNNPNKLAYRCQFKDYGRLLFVYCYDGNIIVYRIGQVTIDLEEINKNLTIPLEEEQYKKKLRYPLAYAVIEQNVGKITQRILEIKFEGKRIPLTKEQIILKLSKKGEAPPPQPQAIKKDPKKKEQKVVQSQKQDTIKQQIQFNQVLQKRQSTLQNGNDITPSYPLPKYKPFVYVINSKIQLQKKKQFQKVKFIKIPQKLVYGWQNFKDFKISLFYPKKTNYIPNFIYIQHFLQKIPDKFMKEKTEFFNQKTVLKNTKALKNISQITATQLSTQEQYFGVGLSNGSVAVWSTNSFNIIFSTQKHKGSISTVAFFQQWKIISGSSKGQVQIDNILTLSNEVKRTNIFQSKIDYPIQSIQVSQLGLAFIIDSNSNLRVYDLWRNEKITKLNSSNSFAIIQNKGKRWISMTNIKPSMSLYTNNDFTVILSTSWPNYTSRQLQQSQSKRNQINNLINNPWISNNTSIHVMRNFQFLLTLFEGLENTFKKGYERKKVENLFTNLQFVQLYDRNFQIPDFGIVNNNNGLKKTQIGFKANSSKSKLSSSQRSRQKLLKQSSSSGQISNTKYKLTNDVLHPQKFLLERRKIDKQQIMTQQKLTSSIRQSFKKQGNLQNTLMNTLKQSGL